MDIRNMIEGGGWKNLAQNKDQWSILVKTVKYVPVP
jgi:hypothetical protein